MTQKQYIQICKIETINQNLYDDIEARYSDMSDDHDAVGRNLDLMVVAHTRRSSDIICLVTPLF